MTIPARSRGLTSHPAIGNKTMNSQYQSFTQGILANPSRTNRQSSRNTSDRKSDLASVYSMVFRGDCKNEFHRLLKRFMGLPQVLSSSRREIATILAQRQTVVFRLSVWNRGISQCQIVAFISVKSRNFSERNRGNPRSETVVFTSAKSQNSSALNRCIFVFWESQYSLLRNWFMY